VQVDHGNARAALAATSLRTTELLRSAGDGRTRAAGLQWTVGEVGAHMVVTLRAFTLAAAGRTDIVEPYIADTDHFPDRISGVTAGTLAIEPERDPAELAGLVAEATERFLSATADRSASEPVPTPWYGRGVTFSLATVTGVLLGEQLVHGHDIARTIGRPWRIADDDARLVVCASTAMMPLAVDRRAAAKVEATYDIRVRGGPSFLVRVGRGTVVVEPARADRIDCHISADAVAFTLVAYGRVSQWGPIAKGKLMAWGRRPWLAFRFKSLFFNP
jgi:uncharacterized protein (TIGR03083 family)